ncbi:MAG: hypothetical protein OXN84_10805 [Albidovulum sp.]|nr:hypothetical protein [Albidovulum sp.]
MKIILAFSGKVLIPARFGYGSDELVIRVLKLFSKADDKVALAYSVSSVDFREASLFVSGAGNPQSIGAARMAGSALHAPLGIAERFA